MRVAGKEVRSKEIADIIRREVVAGRLHPGNKLDGENRLAERFDVGRQVIRSALKILKEENLVRSARGRGAYINDYIPPELSAKRIRIGYVYWQHMLRENSFLRGYRRILMQSREKGCEVYLNVEDNEQMLIDWVRNYQLDGLLISGYVDDALVRTLNDAEILFLVLGNYQLTEPANRLEKDVFNSVKTAMSILLKRYRFTRVAGIFGEMFGLGPQQTLRGIQCAAKENKVKLDESLFFPQMEGSNGYLAMQYLLKEKKIGQNDIIYLSDLAFTGAARAIFEHNLPPEKRPYLFLDMPLGEVPYPDLVGCFLYEENALAEHALDCFLELFYGRVKQPWCDNVECKITIT